MVGGASQVSLAAERSIRRHFIVLAAAIAVLCVVPFENASAQSNQAFGQALGSVLGGAIDNARAENIRKSWLQTDPEIQACLVSIYKIHPAQLAAQGISAQDQRVLSYMQDCAVKIAN